jgi:hypothetical protein
MTQLDDLLFIIRQHPAKDELLKGPGAPEAKEYRPGTDPTVQWAEHIYRSGRRQQDNAWRQFLIGEPTSDKEKS